MHKKECWKGLTRLDTPVQAIRSSFARVFLVYSSVSKGELRPFSARQVEVGEGISKASK